MYRKVVKKAPPTIAIQELDLNKMVVGFKSGRLYFISVESSGKYRITSPEAGIVNNSNQFSKYCSEHYKISTLTSAVTEMVNCCEAVYQVESWKDIAELAELHDALKI